MDTTTPRPVAPGVTGKHRAAYLALTPAQQERWHYHYGTCGRPAAIALRYALAEVPA